MSNPRKVPVSTTNKAAKQSKPQAIASTRDELVAAVIAALVSTGDTSAPNIPSVRKVLKPTSLASDKWIPLKHPVDDTTIRADAAQRMAAIKFTAKVIQGAEARAETLAKYLKSLVATLERVGCKPNEVEGYLRVASQCLASLYLEARQPHPSALTLRQLVLRYALDVRKPVSGNILRFQTRRIEYGWVITEFPSVPEARFASNMGIPSPGVLVVDQYAVRLLDLVFQTVPPIHDVMSLIELVLEKVPNEADAILAEKVPQLFYQLGEKADGEPHVRLWLGANEVSLLKWKDIHRLLAALFEMPETPLSGKEAKKHRVVNASQACGRIRIALNRVWAGAGDWLETDPIQWQKGITPQSRPQRQNKRK